MLYYEEPNAVTLHVRFCEGYMEQSMFLLDYRVGGFIQNLPFYVIILCVRDFKKEVKFVENVEKSFSKTSIN